VDKNLKDWSKMIGHARSMNRQHDAGKRQTEEDVTCENGHPMVFQTRDLATWAHECNMCVNQLGTAFACCTVGCNESFTCEDCFFNAGTPAETLTCQTHGTTRSGLATGQAYQDIHPVVQAAAAAGTPAATGTTTGSQDSWAKALHAYIKTSKMFASATTPKMPSTWKHALESNSCAVRFPYPY